LTLSYTAALLVKEKKTKTKRQKVEAEDKKPAKPRRSDIQPKGQG